MPLAPVYHPLIKGTSVSIIIGKKTGDLYLLQGIGVYFFNPVNFKEEITAKSKKSNKKNHGVHRVSQRSVVKILYFNSIEEINRKGHEEGTSNHRFAFAKETRCFAFFA
jgi:hypothetical protein